MKTFADRLNAALQSAGMSQGQLAEAVGVSQPAIQKLTSGKAQSSRKILEISKALNIRAEWLNSGEEPMRAESNTTPPPESSIPPESEWGTVDAWDNSTPLPSDEVEVPFLKDIELAAGDGSFCEEDFNGYKIRFSKATLRRVGANTDGSGVICFPARGDSMEPIIPDGTTVAVDTNNKRIIDGKLYAISQQGAGDQKLKRVKQLYRKPGGKLVIHSFNREEDEVADEFSVEIMGRIFWYSVIL